MRPDNLEERFAAMVEAQRWCLGLGGDLSMYVDMGGYIIPAAYATQAGGTVATYATGETPWMQIAEREKGTREVQGSGSNPRVLEYLKTCGKSNDETPWCSAFVNWVMIQAGYKGTNNALAKSWLTWGVPVNPVYGCLVILDRGGTKGHVGFLISKTDTHVKLLAGNQSDEVNYSDYPVRKVLGYRWPTK